MRKINKKTTNTYVRKMNLEIIHDVRMRIMSQTSMMPIENDGISICKVKHPCP